LPFLWLTGPNPERRSWKRFHPQISQMNADFKTIESESKGVRGGEFLLCDFPESFG